MRRSHGLVLSVLTVCVLLVPIVTVILRLDSAYQDLLEAAGPSWPGLPEAFAASPWTRAVRAAPLVLVPILLAGACCVGWQTSVSGEGKILRVTIMMFLAFIVLLFCMAQSIVSL